MNHAQIEDVYATLWGAMEKGYEVEGVEDLFAEGKKCDMLYAEMLDAYERLRNRLGTVDEDADVEVIISSLLEICRETGMHMYRCGAMLHGKV